MNLSLNQVTVGATDIEKSFAFYEGLGLHPIVKVAHYARFALGNGASFSIEKMQKVISTTTVYFETESLDEVVDTLQKRGYLFDHLPVKQRWLWYEARLRDPSGNCVCLYHAGENRLNPPWRL